MSRKNHYFALLDEEGECRVTLSAPKWGTSVSPMGIITTSDAEARWSGTPPAWCTSIVEVLSPEPWVDVPEHDKYVHWTHESLLAIDSRIPTYLIPRQAIKAIRAMQCYAPSALELPDVKELVCQLSSYFEKDVTK